MSAKIKSRQVVRRKVVTGKPARLTNKPPTFVEVNKNLDNHQLLVFGDLTKVDKVSPNNGRKLWLSTIQWKAGP